MITQDDITKQLELLTKEELIELVMLLEINKNPNKILENRDTKPELFKAATMIVEFVLFERLINK